MTDSTEFLTCPSCVGVKPHRPTGGDNVRCEACGAVHERAEAVVSRMFDEMRPRWRKLPVVRQYERERRV